MIETITAKREQLRNGYFQSGTGPTTILILGSCRTIFYVNYLVRWNEMSGNKLTILRIDPFDWHWNERNEMVDFEAAIQRCEHDARILDALRRTEIFLHEHFAYYGMFNTSTKQEKNIYRFGLNPRVNICIPNWHDRYVLFQDQVTGDADIRAGSNNGALSPAVVSTMRFNGLRSLDKFYDICRLSSFPEMADHFKANWTKTRFFTTPNHVNRNFSLYLFRQMNDRFLNLPLTDEFWASAHEVNLFSTPYTAVTQYDVDAYGLDWGEPIEPIKL